MSFDAIDNKQFFSVLVLAYLLSCFYEIALGYSFAVEEGRYCYAEVLDVIEAIDVECVGGEDQH